ncbi:MAG: hypothetical protein HY791_18615 [Deltaproteobacteria bacterium]|nr:hypothetical protein [Deltaproteobacteria bacterium]
MARFELAVLLALSGCAPRLSIEMDVPADVDFIGVLFELEGRVVSGSALVPKTRFLDFPGGVDEIDAVRVVGFPAGVLPSFDPERSSQPIRLPRPEDYSFTPTFAARGPVESGLVRPTPVTPEPISADWAPNCPKLVDVGTLVADLSCAATRCAPEASLFGCDLLVDMSPCALGQLSAKVRPDGTLEVSESVLGGCDLAEAPGGVDLAISCREATRTCSLRFLKPPFPADLGESVDSIAHVEGPPGSSGQDHGPFDVGYFGGAVELDSEIIVSTFQTFQSGRACLLDAPSILWFFDRQSLSLTRTATAPPCLQGLSIDPNHPQFLATFGTRAAGISLGRFDENARLVSSIPIPSELGEFRDLLLLPSQDPARPNIVLGTDDDDDGFIAAFRGTQELAYTVGPMGEMIALARGASPSSVGITAGGAFEVVAIEPTGSTRSLIVPIGALCAVSGVKIVDTVYDPPSQRWVAISRHEAQDAHSFGASSGCESAYVVGEAGEPISMIPWPGRPELLAVALALPDGNAAMARYSITQARFLPGLAHIGRGSPGLLLSLHREDPNVADFLVGMDETGELLHVTLVIP